MKEKEKAVALSYEQGGIPKVVAKGTGEIAKQIIAKAEELGIPVQKNEPLVEALAQIELTREIPPELYQAVAEVLAFVHRLDEARKPKTAQAPG